MGAHGVQAAILQDHDEVGALHRGDALGNDQLGHVGQFGQGAADAGLGGSIHGAGGVVENQHLRVPQQGTGNAKALLLSAGDVDAALP